MTGGRVEETPILPQLQQDVCVQEEDRRMVEDGAVGLDEGSDFMCDQIWENLQKLKCLNLVTVERDRI